MRTPKAGESLVKTQFRTATGSGSKLNTWRRTSEATRATVIWIDSEFDTPHFVSGILRIFPVRREFIFLTALSLTTTTNQPTNTSPTMAARLVTRAQPLRALASPLTQRFMSTTPRPARTLPSFSMEGKVGRRLLTRRGY